MLLPLVSHQHSVEEGPCFRKAAHRGGETLSAAL